MNQFVPQLMLGNPLSGSTGPPAYDPVWSTEKSWVFASQYFMELQNATSGEVVAKAAAGQKFPTAAGEVLWTSFARSADFVWTLAMGVKGDAARTSVVFAPKPFLGFVDAWSSSWDEDAYAEAHLNSCWELYGVETRNAYPATGSVYDMRTVQTAAPLFPFADTWSNVEEPTCPGHPEGKFSVASNATVQDVTWTIGWW